MSGQVQDITRMIGAPISPIRMASVVAGKAAEQRAATAYNEGNYTGAIEGFTEAIRRGLDHADVHAGLATAYMFTGRSREAIAEYQLSIQRDPRDPKVFINLAFLLDHQPETTLELALAARTAVWRRFGLPLRSTWTRHRNDPDPERPLRIGYVSGDFRRHSAATVFAPIVLRHSEGYRPVCYYTAPAPEGEDAVTACFIEQTEFHRVATLYQDDLADRIRADQIDILVDLSGFSAFNRLGTFYRRPAPVQVTGWGYATGTGIPVPAMDGFFADAVTVPRALAARGYAEPILYLPSIVPFSPMPYSDAPSPLPCLARRSFTFGSFNRWLKMTEAVLRVWGQILAAVPGSRLLLKEKIYEREDIRRQVLAALGAQGVAAERIEFRGWTPHDEHIQAYHEVDLALDPFPHAGGVTALEGLWHGVPPVTLLGERVPERLSASFCASLQLPMFVAHSVAEYIEAAVGFATAYRPQLAAIRQSLQYRFVESPLCKGYVQAVETHYRDLWRQWCRRQTA